jgi:ABC-type sugar transport system ATPase subunit
VLVTHHLGDILPEIERMILMRDGRIVGDGPREELLTEARLSELFPRRCALAATRSGCIAGKNSAPVALGVSAGVSHLRRRLRVPVLGGAARAFGHCGSNSGHHSGLHGAF